MSNTSLRRRPFAPPGRLWFADFAAALGVSTRTARRLYRPSDPDALRAWAIRLDFRESSYGLHCDKARALALREEQLANLLGGPVAAERCSRANRLESIRMPQR